MKDTMWFKHDVNARNDVRIVKLRSRLGWEGYAWYFALVEIMGESHGYKIEDDGEMELTIACLLGVDAAKAQKFLEVTTNVGLFQKKDGFLYSHSLLRRMTEWVEKSKTYKKNALRSWESRRGKDAMAMQLHSNGKAIADADKTIPYKTIIEDKREEKSKRVAFSIPTIQEVREYCRQRKNNVNPEKWFSHYEANGWKVGRNPMKSWKAAIHTWEHSEFNTENSINAPQRASVAALAATQAVCDENAFTDHCEAFHNANTVGGVCHFCKIKIGPIGYCRCVDYQKAYTESKKSFKGGK